VTIPVAGDERAEYVTLDELPKRIAALRKEMTRAASNLEFERAARYRDLIRDLEMTMDKGEAVVVAAPGDPEEAVKKGRRKKRDRGPY
jgi:excinuclease UvrABC nuclease subunit